MVYLKTLLVFRSRFKMRLCFSRLHSSFVVPEMWRVIVIFLVSGYLPGTVVPG